MGIAILSDIHANLAALRAVLDHAGDVDAIWCLGDTVGYGPMPNECIAKLRDYDTEAVAGNHDLAAVGKMATDEFNDAAAEAARWTAEQLSSSSRVFLGSLPLIRESGEFTLVHGSIRWPIWEYLLSAEQAQAQFDLQETPYSLVGHTHVPAVWTADESTQRLTAQIEDGTTVELGDAKLILNPGGVGQPRDGDPRAAYAVYDVGTGTVTFHRVKYDIEETQGAMQEARLPQWLIERLSYGR